jgi:hypothetical protein
MGRSYPVRQDPEFHRTRKSVDDNDIISTRRRLEPPEFPDKHSCLNHDRDPAGPRARRARTASGNAIKF